MNGQYAFLLTGYDASGLQMAVAGTITADGNGHITSGAVDLNDNLVVSSSSAVTGVYTSDANHRGIISFTNTLGSVARPLAFTFSMKANGTTAEMIGFDANNFIISGTMQKQDSNAFSLSALAGNFVFETDSHGPIQRSNIGSFTLQSNGSAAGIDDASIAGVGPLVASNQFSGLYAAPGANGRALWTVSENGVTKNYEAYIISASKFVAIQTDSVDTIGSTVATRQNAVTAAALANTAGVFSMTGLDISAGRTISAIGTLSVANSTTGNLLWDANDGGTPDIAQNAPNEVLTYDPSTGRGTITFVGGNGSGSANGLFDSAVFYLSDVDAGFILDTGTGANNRALAGPLQPQFGVGSFGNGSLSANMIGVGTSGDTFVDALGEDILFAVSSSNNSLFGLEDVAAVGSESGNQSFTGLGFSGINATSGRGTITASGISLAFYLAAPNQFVFLSVGSGSSSRYFPVIPQ